MPAMKQLAEVDAGGGGVVSAGSHDASRCSVTMHQKIVDELRAEAMAIRPENIRTPLMPMPIYLDEGASVVQAAEVCFDDLSAVGMKRSLLDRTQLVLRCLRSAQTLWAYQKLSDTPFQLDERVERGDVVLEDALGRAAIASAGTPDEARIEAIRSGEGDVPSKLSDLALVVGEAPGPIAELGLDADAFSRKLNDTAEDVIAAKAEIDALTLVTDGRELRDRIYTLSLEPIAKIRAFAQFAYRTGPSQKKRANFVSGYIRARNRRYYKKAQAGAGEGEVEKPETPAASNQEGDLADVA